MFNNVNSIWLFDLLEKLASIPLKDGSKRYFHGFDVTDGMLLAVLPSDITFSVHDILKSFHEEHKSKCDFMHVRLLVYAIKEVGIKTALQNVTELLLKPSLTAFIIPCDYYNQSIDSPLNKARRLYRVV